MTQIDCHKNKRGFVLIAVAGVMLILGIVLLKTFPVSTDIQLKSVDKTGDKLTEIKRALLIYYEREGELPCPADPDIAMNLEEFGEADCSNSVDNDPVFEGGVPFKDLGLPASYAFDDWKKRITYVMDASYTGYESGGDNIDINDINGDDITGANGGVIPQFMGLVISHGEDGVGAYSQGRDDDATRSVPCGGDENCNGDTGDTIFVKDSWSAGYDDLVEVLTPCPGAVNGCSLWLDADDDNGDNIDTSGDFVWMDKSGNGNDASQATASRKPTVIATGINGKRSLEFDGGDFANTTSRPINTDDYSLFVVADQTNPDDKDLLGSGGQWSAGNFILRNYADRARADYWQTSTNLRWAQGADTPREVPIIYSSTLDETSISVARDGFTETTTSVPTARANVDKPIYIGSVNTSTGDAFEGQMGEVVVYDKPLTTEQRTRVQCEMARKWGVFPKEGLQLWLDAQDVDGDFDTTDNPSDGTAITSWVDKSDNSFSLDSRSDPDMTQDTDDPTYRTSGIGASLPSVEFDSTRNDYLSGPVDAFLQPSTNELTVISVVHGSENGGTPEFFLSYSNSNKAWIAGTGRFYVGGGTWSILSTAANSNSSAMVRTHRYDGTTQDAFINSGTGYSQSVSLTMSTTSGERIRVGRSGFSSSSAHLEGHISEILMYNRALSDEERRIAECYLSEKWDVNISYPSP